MKFMYACYIFTTIYVCTHARADIYIHTFVHIVLGNWY